MYKHTQTLTHARTHTHTHTCISAKPGARMAPYVRLYALAGSSLIVMAGAYKQWRTGSLFGPPPRSQ